MVTKLHKPENEQVTDKPQRKVFVVSTLVGLKLWLKLEAAIPFVLIDASSAYKEFHLAVITCLVVACLSTIIEENLLIRLPMPFLKLASILVGTAIIPISAYLLLLLHLKHIHQFGDPFASYGIKSVFGFLCGLILLGRLSAAGIESKSK